MKNINKVYVFNTGLSDLSVEYINDFPKFEVIKTGLEYDSGAVHDDGWKKNTYSKTKFLLDILTRDNIPTFMIDSDTIFLDSFDNLIDWNVDVVACGRNRKGFSKHIGSFFGAINIDNSKTFLLKWIKNIDFLQKETDLKHCESPALSKTIQEENYKIQEIPEQIVSAVFPNEESIMIHLKSDHYAITVKDRLALPHARSFTQRYL